MHSELQMLVELSKEVGDRIDYIQGGGGNTSVKVDDVHMAIKASGFELKDLTSQKGFTFVNFNTVTEAFHQLPHEISQESDNDTVNYIQTQIQEIEGYLPARPSIETGFHSILDRCVLHSHSVYSNLLNCSEEGAGLIQEIFPGEDVIFVDYFAPGTVLTKRVLEACMKSADGKGRTGFPNIIFLKNHGVIVHHREVDACITLHRQVTDRITQFFNIDVKRYPGIHLTKLDDNLFESRNSYLTTFFANNPEVDQRFFDQTLFPDQTVYFKDNFSFEKTQLNKVNVSQDRICYRTNEKEARTIEQTLLAFLYIRNTIEELGLNPQFIQEKEVDYIHNMESETYRKNMLKSE